MPQKRRRRRTTRQSRRRRRGITQRGRGAVGVVAGIPKAAWSITKGLETLAKKNGKRAHRKRMVEIRKGKRKSYGGESFSLM